MSKHTTGFLWFFLLVEAVLVLAVLAKLHATYAGASGSITVIQVPAAPSSIVTPAVVDDDEGLDGLALEKSTDPRIQAAGAALDGGRVDEAITLFQVLVDERPDHVEVRVDLGLALQQAGKIPAARRALEQATKLDKKSVSARVALGTLLLREGLPAEGIPQFDEALVINPHHVTAHLNRGVAYARLGQLDRAEADYLETTRLDRTPNGVAAWYNLALLRLRQMRVREALDCLTDGLRLKPDHQRSRYKRAVVLARIGLDEESATEYRKLLDVAPDHASGLTNLGALLLRLNRAVEAEPILRRATMLKETPTRAAYNLGVCLLQLDRHADAIPVLQAAVAKDPAHAATSYNLGIAFLRGKQDKEAASAFAVACKLDPAQPEYHYNHGLALAGAGDDVGASREFTEALRLKPEYLKAWLQLARSRDRLNDGAAALVALEKAKALQPDNRSIWRQIGETLLKMKRPVDAEKMFRHALTLEEVPEDMLLLADSLIAQKRDVEALTELRRALALAPRDVEVNSRLAQWHIDRDDWKEALKHLDLASELRPDAPTAFNAGMRAYRANRFSEALTIFEFSARSPKRLSAAGNMRGLCLVALDRAAEAVPVLREAVAADPHNLKARLSLARAQRSTKDLASAITTLREASEIDAKSASTWRLLSEMLIDAGQAQQAVEAATRAVTIEADDSANTLALGRALLAAGDASGAAQRIRNFLSVHPGIPDLQAFLDTIPPQKEKP